MVVYVENLKDKDVSKKKAHSAKSTLLPSWRRTSGSIHWICHVIHMTNEWSTAGLSTDRQTEEEQIAKAVGEKNTLQ